MLKLKVLFRNQTMKHAYFIVIITLASALTACMTDSHHYTQNAQKIISAVNTQYPAVANTLVFIDAPEGYIARYFDNDAVEDNVDTGKVAAIICSLAVKTNTVVVAGEDEKLTATTLAKAPTLIASYNALASTLLTSPIIKQLSPSLKLVLIPSSAETSVVVLSKEDLTFILSIS